MDVQKLYSSTKKGGTMKGCHKTTLNTVSA